MNPPPRLPYTFTDVLLEVAIAVFGGGALMMLLAKIAGI